MYKVYLRPWILGRRYSNEIEITKYIEKNGLKKNKSVHRLVGLFNQGILQLNKA